MPVDIVVLSAASELVGQLGQRHLSVVVAGGCHIHLRSMSAIEISICSQPANAVVSP